jgi:hypothetical protein
MRHAVAIAMRLSLALCCAPVPRIAAAQTPPDKQSVLRQAWQAYYGLRGHGLISFQCDVAPDWRPIVQALPSQAVADAALEVLEGMHFTATLGEDYSVTVEHHDLAGQHREMAATIRPLYDGVEQMTEVFLETWKLFMLTPPLPPIAGTYELETSGERHRLSYTVDGVDFRTTLTADLAIAELTITTAAFTNTFRPRFEKTPDGFVLTGYDASFRPARPEDATEVRVDVEYQTVAALRLLRKLTIAATDASGPIPRTELTFSNCQARNWR